MDQGGRARVGVARKKALATLLPSESWSERSVRERALALESACSAAIEIMTSTGNLEERLGRIDPIPASTLRVIRALTAKQHVRAGSERD
jgi:hypothetical protein